ncbi:rhodanese-like domain-containing protein [Desulfosarcina sp. OttesenSCG-928-A07]|nr:rhodanese-like domain-containing protein [Desulfosarcina sp. OttesenSCG-928-A07]
MKWKSTLREALLIVLVAVVVSGIVYEIRPDKINSAKISPNSGSVSGLSSRGDAAARLPESEGQADENQNIREISLEEARQYFDVPGTIFADARHELDFSAGHIQGARNFVEEDQDAWLNDFLAETGPDTVIITYCDGDDCHLAVDLAEVFVLSGFTRVYYLKNGWTQWQKKGFPTETGKEGRQTAEK